VGLAETAEASEQQADPKAIVEMLATRKITNKDRGAQERKMVLSLESLAEVGEKAILILPLPHGATICEAKPPKQ